MYKVALVDDHTLLSEAIGGLVRQFINFEVVNISVNGKEFINYLENADSDKPDVVLMDVKMPVMGGVETTKYLSKHYPRIKVLALSVEEEESVVMQMIRSGAKGYLLKDTRKSILEQALLEVINYGFYYTNTVERIVSQTENLYEEEVVLKDREIEFIKHACTEMTYKQIAEKMFLSPKTIEGYRESVFQKLGLKNRTGLVIYAIKNNIFTP
ncbi:response regulator transcription factor [Leeuwenhoekiella marinoflava]|uniref:LuxR family two component transcriptional regulator n=2 Tax=Leeuwenhoekiella marinoflava TaxID=988 RepID=A0A4Q0P8A2_9FLAO|nr:response regulator transcription factor [Leeuwenhoekiella marinoflava]RXG22396.1 LuxR family two component transcriptional regulator [Leeuwenhoekiella marinoflava]SHF31466.1 two component transcriptional regulator, LuxR family [Leeuwenhoekiella marinoflava DSM 3653]